jgi:hypothetical protein
MLLPLTVALQGLNRRYVWRIRIGGTDSPGLNTKFSSDVIPIRVGTLITFPAWSRPYIFFVIKASTFFTSTTGAQ